MRNSSLLVMMLTLPLCGGCDPPDPPPVGEDAAIYEVTVAEWRNQFSWGTDKDGPPLPWQIHLVDNGGVVNVPIPDVWTEVPRFDRYDLVGGRVDLDTTVCGATRQATIQRIDGLGGLSANIEIDMTEHWQNTAAAAELSNGENGCQGRESVPNLDGDYDSQLIFSVEERCTRGCRDFPITEQFFAYEEKCGCM